MRSNSCLAESDKTKTKSWEENKGRHCVKSVWVRERDDILQANICKLTTCTYILSFLFQYISPSLLTFIFLPYLTVFLFFLAFVVVLPDFLSWRNWIILNSVIAFSDFILLLLKEYGILAKITGVRFTPIPKSVLSDSWKHICLFFTGFCFITFITFTFTSSREGESQPTGNSALAVTDKDVRGPFLSEEFPAI